MLASPPASILNHKMDRNGIPSDSVKAGTALVLGRVLVASQFRFIAEFSNRLLLVFFDCKTRLLKGEYHQPSREGCGLLWCIGAINGFHYHGHWHFGLTFRHDVASILANVLAEFHERFAVVGLGR